MPDSLSFDMEKFQAAIAAQRPEPLAEAEKVQIGRMLMHPLLQKLLANAFWQMTDVGGAVAALDLTTLAGISTVVKMQGMIHGLDMFITTLGAYAVRPDEE